MRKSGQTIDFWKIENANGVDFQNLLISQNDKPVHRIDVSKCVTPVFALAQAIIWVDTHSIKGDNISVNVTVQ